MGSRQAVGCGHGKQGGVPLFVGPHHQSAAPRRVGSPWVGIRLAPSAPLPARCGAPHAWHIPAQAIGRPSESGPAKPCPSRARPGPVGHGVAVLGGSASGSPVGDRCGKRRTRSPAGTGSCLRLGYAWALTWICSHPAPAAADRPGAMPKSPTWLLGGPSEATAGKTP